MKKKSIKSKLRSTERGAAKECGMKLWSTERGHVGVKECKMKY